MTKLDKMRALIPTLSTADLLNVIDEAEARTKAASAEDGEGFRILFSLACAEVCERLELDAETVAKSALGPAEHLRLIATTRA
jgi:hypothetical protein